SLRRSQSVVVEGLPGVCGDRGEMATMTPPRPGLGHLIKTAVRQSGGDAVADRAGGQTQHPRPPPARSVVTIVACPWGRGSNHFARRLQRTAGLTWAVRTRRDNPQGSLLERFLTEGIGNGVIGKIDDTGRAGEARTPLVRPKAVLL